MQEAHDIDTNRFSSSTSVFSPISSLFLCLFPYLPIQLSIFLFIVCLVFVHSFIHSHSFSHTSLSSLSPFTCFSFSLILFLLTSSIHFLCSTVLFTTHFFLFSRLSLSTCGQYSFLLPSFSSFLSSSSHLSLFLVVSCLHLFCPVVA